ncbi:hypothetical protein J9303_12040, partial [Bacillaceae bacterium Marseille-Q3522]|nr:hypothetical protein [Bacillaceae bacterium Marseille-Q3522]
MQILQVVHTTWILVRRNLIFWLILLGFMIYNFLGFFYYTSAENYSPGSALTDMSYSVQGGILAFLFLGITFIRIEE